MIHHWHKTAKSGCYWHILCPCPKMNSFPDFPWHQQGQSTCEMKSALPPAQWDEQNGKSHLKRAQNQVKTVFGNTIYNYMRACGEKSNWVLLFAQASQNHYLLNPV